MSLSPVHWRDKEDQERRAECGVTQKITVDILKVIEKMASEDIREGHLKTENFEIRIKR